MIIRPREDRSQDIKTLQALAARPDATEKTRQAIDLEIKKIRAGERAEADAAREIDGHYGASAHNWLVIHDLRLEFDGLIAQIDHLIIGRFLDIFVCESKNFSEGVAINEHGEFTAFFAGKPRGLPSPIEQNRRHIDVLDRLFTSGRVKLPTRLGFPIPPNYESLILVSAAARIARPKRHVGGIESIIKNDQIITTITKRLDARQGTMTIAKVISPETLRDLGERIAAQHTPITFNWAAKFGLSESNPVAMPAPAPSGEDVAAIPSPPLRGGRVEPTFSPSPESAKAAPASEPAASSGVDAPAEADPTAAPKKLFCAKCRSPVPYAVAKFCWTNKGRFGGKVYCIPHQAEMSASSK